MWTFIWSLRDEDTTLPVSCTTNTDTYIRLSDAGADGNVLCKVECENVFLNSRHQYYRLSATNHWLSIAEKSKQLVNYLRTGNSNLESKVRLSAHEMAYSFLISWLLITDYYKKTYPPYYESCSDAAKYFSYYWSAHPTFHGSYRTITGMLASNVSIAG